MIIEMHPPQLLLQHSNYAYPKCMIIEINIHPKYIFYDIVLLKYNYYYIAKKQQA